MGRERLRQILRRKEVSWQRTRTWKESKDPDFDAKLDRIEEVTTKFPTHCSPSTISGRCRSARTTAEAGPRSHTRTGCRRPTIARTASVTSTAAGATPGLETSPGRFVLVGTVGDDYPHLVVLDITEQYTHNWPPSPPATSAHRRSISLWPP